MRPREGHRGHLKGRMMFLWSYLYDGTLHPLAFGTLSSGSHGFWVLFDEEDTSDSLFPRTSEDSLFFLTLFSCFSLSAK